MKYHLIGDMGISMQGIRQYLLSLGHAVTGSDLKNDGHNAKNITADIDLVVRSSAINPGSEGWCEVEEAERRGIKVIKRSELLGELTKDKKLIAVSGMHGKTTISTLAGLILIKAGLDPTVLIGEKVKEFGDDVLHIGKSDWFVAEVCEYDRSFLDFHPLYLILTNIEEEHLDTYPNGLPEIKKAFLQYLTSVRRGGTVIACYEDQNVRDVIKKSGLKNIIFYGKGAEKYNQVDFKIQLPGYHNRLNFLAICALADLLEIDKKIVEEVAREYSGAKRRFEIKGRFKGAAIIDDYGHHPTEIKATIQAMKEKYPDKKLIVVFWPHQYKRILPLLHKFGQAFSQADEVILKPIYLVPGRDEVLDVSSEDIEKLISKEGIKSRVMEKDEEIINYLKNNLSGDTVLLTIGIPPVYKIAESLTK